MLMWDQWTTFSGHLTFQKLLATRYFVYTSTGGSYGGTSDSKLSLAGLQGRQHQLTLLSRSLKWPPPCFICKEKFLFCSSLDRPVCASSMISDTVTVSESLQRMHMVRWTQDTAASGRHVMGCGDHWCAYATSRFRGKQRNLICCTLSLSCIKPAAQLLFSKMWDRDLNIQFCLGYQC